MLQSALPILKTVCPPRPADMEVVGRLPTFRSALRYAVNHSGLGQEDIAEVLGIDRASFSRMICDPRHHGARPREFPHEKLSDFCLVTGSIAPIQWHAFRAGGVLAFGPETRVAHLERELAAARANAYVSGAAA